MIAYEGIFISYLAVMLGTKEIYQQTTCSLYHITQPITCSFFIKEKIWGFYFLAPKWFLSICVWIFLLLFNKMGGTFHKTWSSLKGCFRCINSIYHCCNTTGRVYGVEIRCSVACSILKQCVLNLGYWLLLDNGNCLVVHYSSVTLLSLQSYTASAYSNSRELCGLVVCLNSMIGTQ